MNFERWQQLDELFHAALGRSGEDRAAFVKDICADDEMLCKQLERLLVAHEDAGSFIERSAIEIEARAIVDQENVQNDVANGAMVNHYRILSPIAAGGMGQVFLAEDVTLGRQVALKLLPPEFTGHTDRVRRFQQEARAASSLNHPNIITIHEIGQAVDRYYISFEHLQGLNLREYLQGSQSRSTNRGGNQRLKLTEALSITTQVADALAAVHAKGIVHRDIKPENIMLVTNWRMMQKDTFVKVLDFGIAKLAEPQIISSKIGATASLPFETNEGLVIGTANYMSPEQARGEEVDPRTDIWSLGIVLYEMLTGSLPFANDAPQDIITPILNEKLSRLPTPVSGRINQILKKALCKDREERYQNIRDMFCDLCEAQEQNAMSAEQTKSNSTIAKRVVVTFQQHKFAAILLLPVLLLAIAIGAYLITTATRATANIDSVAVLPFTNINNDPNIEYLSDGLSIGLTNRLSQLRQLKVIAQNSAFKYKGKDVDVQEAAKTLRVQAIVVGSIVPHGDSLRIDVELVRAQDKTQLWGQQYDGRTADIQAVQQEIAREIIKTLQVKLTYVEEQRFTKSATNNSDAYQRFLNAELCIRKTGRENTKKALDYSNEAIALDPNFAQAYAGIAEGYNIMAGDDISARDGKLDPKETNALAKVAARKALLLDETLAKAHTWLARIELDEWDWSDAEREFKRGLELDPNIPTTHAIYTFYLTAFGLHAEAMAEIKRAEEVDPLQVRPRYREGVILYYARRYDEAIRQLQNTLDLQPDFSGAHFFIGASYAMKGEYAKAIAEYAKENSNDNELCIQPYVSFAYAMLGKRDESLAILKQLKTTTGYVSPAQLAVLYTGLGNKEAAFESLERAYIEHDLQLQYLKVDPHYDSLRSDPRFADLTRRVGLPL